MAGHPDFVMFTRSWFLGLLLWMKPRGVNKFFDLITPSDIKAFFAFIEESVAARRGIEEGLESLSKGGKGMRQDMFHFLFQARDRDTGKQLYSQQELFAETSLLVVAGSDTSSFTLCGFFFYIARNPGPYEKLVKEMSSTFGSLGREGGAWILAGKVNPGARLGQEGPASRRVHLDARGTDNPISRSGTLEL